MKICISYSMALGPLTEFTPNLDNTPRYSSEVPNPSPYARQPSAFRIVGWLLVVIGILGVIALLVYILWTQFSVSRDRALLRQLFRADIATVSAGVDFGFSPDQPADPYDKGDAFNTISLQFDGQYDLSGDAPRLIGDAEIVRNGREGFRTDIAIENETVYLQPVDHSIAIGNSTIADASQWVQISSGQFEQLLTETFAITSPYDVFQPRDVKGFRDVLLNANPKILQKLEASEDLADGGVVETYSFEVSSRKVKRIFHAVTPLLTTYGWNQDQVSAIGTAIDVSIPITGMAEIMEPEHRVRSLTMTMDLTDAPLLAANGLLEEVTIRWENDDIAQRAEPEFPEVIIPSNARSVSPVVGAPLPAGSQEEGNEAAIDAADPLGGRTFEEWQRADDDKDGLTNAQESRTYNTDPLQFDTDGDGFGDGEEVQNGFDPLN